jgi:hypothetical protein
VINHKIQLDDLLPKKDKKLFKLNIK